MPVPAARPGDAPLVTAAHLLDDRIGVTLDPTTGTPLPHLYESDDDRGLVSAGGVDAVQTDVEVTAVGLRGL